MHAKGAGSSTVTKEVPCASAFWYNFIILKTQGGVVVGLYEGIKGVAKVVQQADNLELYQRLLI